MLGDGIMHWGFINGSPNAHGHTARLAQYLLADQSQVSWNLVEHHVAQLGQQRQAQDDDFLAIAKEVAAVDALLIGTPIYWSDMTGLLKTFLDRCTLVARQFDFSQIPVYVLINGTQSPTTTAAGIAPAVAQLCDFLKMDFQDAIYVDTSVIVQPADYAAALHNEQQKLHMIVKAG